MTYWLISLKRVDTSNTFDVTIQHGHHQFSYRYTSEQVGRLWVLKVDRAFRADFTGDDGIAAARHLHRWVSRASRGASLLLPIDLTKELPRDERDERNPPPSDPVPRSTT